MIPPSGETKKNNQSKSGQDLNPENIIPFNDDKTLKEF
jgi:hypothetical protein